MKLNLEYFGQRKYFLKKLLQRLTDERTHSQSCDSGGGEEKEAKETLRRSKYLVKVMVVLGTTLDLFI